MKVFLLLIAPLFIALPGALACKDDSDLKWKNGEFTLNCAFLTKNPSKAEKRTNNWCDKTVKDVNTKKNVLVENKCRKSCRNCSNNGGGGNDCTDDPYYTFGKYTFQGKKITRTCHWISSVDEIAKQRRTNWCNRTMNGYKVKKKCPATCFVCNASEEEGLTLMMKE